MGSWSRKKDSEGFVTISLRGFWFKTGSLHSRGTLIHEGDEEEVVDRHEESEGQAVQDQVGHVADYEQEQDAHVEDPEGPKGTSLTLVAVVGRIDLQQMYGAYEAHGSHTLDLICTPRIIKNKMLRGMCTKAIKRRRWHRGRALNCSCPSSLSVLATHSGVAFASGIRQRVSHHVITSRSSSTLAMAHKHTRRFRKTWKTRVRSPMGALKSALCWNSARGKAWLGAETVALCPHSCKRRDFH